MGSLSDVIYDNIMQHLIIPWVFLNYTHLIICDNKGDPIKFSPSLYLYLYAGTLNVRSSVDHVQGCVASLMMVVTILTFMHMEYINYKCLELVLNHCHITVICVSVWLWQARGSFLKTWLSELYMWYGLTSHQQSLNCIHLCYYCGRLRLITIN